MELQIILVYCLCADMLLALHHGEDPESEMSDAEGMTTGIVAALYLGGKHKHACACSARTRLHLAHVKQKSV